MDDTASSQMYLPWPWHPVKRRRHLEDIFFKDGNILCNTSRKQIPLENQDITEDDIKHVPQFSCSISHCMKTFSTISGYELHYNTIHRNVCSHCHRSLPTNHLLELHIQEWHDAMFEILAKKQNMFQCLLATCPEKFPTTKARKNHLIKVHKYPSNFRFDRPRKLEKNKSQECQDKTEENATTNNMEVESLSSGRKLKTSHDQNSQIPENSHISQSGRRFVYSVPRTICFGQGCNRGFQRPTSGNKKKNKKKHWHQQGTETMDTEINIEDVKLDDIAKALHEC